MHNRHYIIPSHYASYLCNGDDSGLDGEELETIKAFLKAEGLGLGSHDWDIKRNADGVAEEPYTFSWHDLDNSQALVLDFVVTDHVTRYVLPSFATWSLPQDKGIAS